MFTPMVLLLAAVTKLFPRSEIVNYLMLCLENESHVVSGDRGRLYNSN